MRRSGDNAARVIASLDAEPQTLATVARRAGLPRRRVEEAIEAIRRDGIALVCSGPDGVWLAGSLDEAQANVEARRRRAITQLLTVRGERRLLRRLATPTGTLWGDAA